MLKYVRGGLARRAKASADIGLLLGFILNA